MIKFTKKYEDSEIKVLCDDKDSLVEKPDISDNEELELEIRKEILLDYEFIKKKSVTNLDFIKRTLKKSEETMDKLIKDFNFEENFNIPNNISDNIFYLVITKIKPNSDDLFEKISEDDKYLEYFNDILKDTNKLCLDTDAFLKEKKNIDPIAKSLIKFRGYFN
jgi:hypothetical protein